MYCEEKEEYVYLYIVVFCQAMQRKKWYFASLKKVLEAKQQKDRERTTEDNHRDFKNDLLEDIGRILNDQDYAEI